MKLFFHIHYKTNYGQSLVLEITSPKSKTSLLPLQTFDGENWQATLDHNSKALSYVYAVKTGAQLERECGSPRIHNLPKGKKEIIIHDQWRAYGVRKNIFQSAAFSEVFLKRATVKKKPATKLGDNVIQFNLNIPNIDQDYFPAVIGDADFLGNWKKPIALNEENFPNVQVNIPTKTSALQFEYKYVLCNKSDGSIAIWESGSNRQKSVTLSKRVPNLLMIHDEEFRYEQFAWRAAGMAIPVFSQRSKQGYGIGEFSDLMGMADWAEKTALKIIQVLPVNDTIATKTWTDSYPYAAISVFALHPIYINIDKIAAFKNKKDQEAYEKERLALNKLAEIDFEKVLTGKFKYFNILYQQEKEKVFASKAYQTFFMANKDWLIPYAAFSFLRDKYDTPNFKEWPTHSKYKAAAIQKMCAPKSKSYSAIAFYFFLQYFADRQLKEAKNYCREKSVVLKGDLPIGIYRYSADAWVAPELYNMEEQAGAPPDDYAVLGQNWGFPTYNWEVMAKDNFKWWQQRMQQLAVYFDALRIDHILGFFRIWQVPIHQIEGTLGLFNPRLPFSAKELAGFGLSGDLSTWTKPYIHETYLRDLFGSDTDFVIKEFLNPLKGGGYQLKPQVDNQVKIRQVLATKKYASYLHLLKPLTYLVSEVLLIEEPGKSGFYNPRITLSTTYFYQSLSEQQRHVFDAIYGNYYFSRHNEFWKKQALWKLPALLQASDMLICGEDLGMIPASVPGVMDRLNIIPLEIQRMSKGQADFGIPWEYDYFSVCSPSCHDMSTIRGWWEEDPATTQKYYNQHLRRYGVAPESCSPALVETINQEHLNAHSIFAIFPIQDLVGMHEKMRKADANSERINIPANPKHYWRFRFHLATDELLAAENLNSRIQEMVEKSGRQ